MTWCTRGWGGGVTYTDCETTKAVVVTSRQKSGDLPIPLNCEAVGHLGA